MSCSSNIQAFLGQRFTYQCQYNYQYYTYTTVQLAQWVSYQSYRAPQYGLIPISLIIAQWGIESGWGGPNISQYYNPGEQADPCGYCSNGSQPNGLPVFCDIRYGVQSYSALIINGYPHVMHAYSDAAGGAAGMKQAAIALGQGYEAGISLSSNYCTGGQTRTIDSSHPRLWATSKYNDGNGPGSSIYDTINANTCLSQYNYAQTTDPGVSLC